MSDKSRTDSLETLEESANNAYKEFIDACDQGEPADLDEFCARFPSLISILRPRLETFLANMKEPESGADHPRRIGPYRVLSVIGEGGMGVVYLVEQEKPVRRKVAVKLIRPGMDSRSILRRFESERQALALMEHPCIAQVYDTGTTDDGRPYFAMEYVRGISLDKYCDRNKVPLRDRLVLFMQICDAVQHAHQKAIMHRDLKPSNVLVASQGEQAVPKIIDFGLAKAMGLQLSERTLSTEHGVLVGTPEYMSPEQADPTALDVDTRTDIYSLGVILYRLLTGALPFDLSDFGTAANFAAFEAIRKKVCDEEPPKPSTRVGTGVEKSTPIPVGKSRSLDRNTLAKRLRGDLDWIVMKALEKDRTRRYSTANDFATDIQRHLDHDPVLAGPPNRAYRLRKLLRKNAGTMVSLALVLVSIMGAGAISMFFWWKAELEADAKTLALGREKRESNAKTLALEREKKATHKAIESQRREKKQRQLAQEAKEQYEQMADVKRLQDLSDEADELWPADQSQVQALESWIGKAKALAERMETHRDTLHELRKRALPYDEETREEDRQTHPSFSRLQLLRDRLREINASTKMRPASKVREKRKLSKSIARLASEVSERRTWRFENVKDQWHHDTVTELVKNLERLIVQDLGRGMIADVESRLLFAKTVYEKTIENHRDAWIDAIASISADGEPSPYEGHEIEAQLGLVPIGQDPSSLLWEFAHLQTGEIPYRNDDGKLVLTEATGLVFVLIPGGSFWMGSQKEDKDGKNYDPDSDDDEAPPHEIRLDPYFLSKYEMTQKQWERFTGKNPSHYQSEKDVLKKPGLHPVEKVSWDDCHAVLSKLNLRLPTEAQWEYAARAGSTTVRWTGNDPSTLAGATNLADQFLKEHGGPRDWIYEDWLNDGYAKHAPIGHYSANRFGLHDVYGNVWEWTLDGNSSYSSPVREGDGSRLVSNSRFRVYRGGSFNSPAVDARSAGRNTFTAETRMFHLGVRPSRRIDP